MTSTDIGRHTPARPNPIMRQAVVFVPLILVNAAAMYGQHQWATDNLTGGNPWLAALFALTVESVAVYLAYEAHAALLAGDAAFRLRAASYGAALLVAGLNYSHFAGPEWSPTTAALAFASMSAISPWLWSIRSRSMKRDQLRSAGLIDQRTAHFAFAKWINFPFRTLGAFRHSVDYGISAERAAWEGWRDRESSTPAPRVPVAGREQTDLDTLPHYETKRDAIRHAFAAVGSYDVPAALRWLAERGVTVSRNEAYAVRRADTQQPHPAPATQLERLDQPNGNGHGHPHELAEVEQS